MLRVLCHPTTVRIRRPLVPLGLLFGFATLFAGYLYATRFVSNNSDNANMILESQAMLHGNVILHRWYLPADSFITSEMPLDAVGSLFFTSAQLLKITPALLYAATVFGATYLATRCVPAPATRWLAAGACLALIAFPIGQLFSMVMLGPIHMSTIVLSLLAWFAYDCFVKRPASLSMLGLFTLVTTLAIIGDPMAELLIVVPVGIVSGWVVWRTRGQEMTARATLGGAVLALLLGIGMRQVLIMSGTHIGSSTPGLVSPDHIWPHIQWLVLGICMLFHIDLRQGLGFDQRALFVVLNGGFLLVGIVGFVRFFRQLLIAQNMRNSLTSVLSWAIVSSFAVFLVTDFASTIGGIRYLLPAFIYAGILCYPAFAQVISRRHLRQTILALLLVSGLTFGVMLAQASEPSVPEQPVIAFLQSHHLSSGLGSYWAAGITTLKSNGQVRVLPVVQKNGRIHAFRWHANAAWFEPEELSAAQFVLIDSSVPVGPFQEAVTNSFGPPDHLYHLDGFTIFAWDYPMVSRAIDLN